jgi:hypothetical protein
MPLLCYICSQHFTNFTIYRRHLSLYHTIHHSGVEVKCGQEFCPRMFTTFAALGRHLQQCHSDLMTSGDLGLDMSISSPVLQQSVENEDLDSNSTVNCDMQQCNEIPNVVNITSSCLQFLTQLQQKSNMTQANIQVVADNLHILLSDVSDYSCSRVEKNVSFC